MEAIIWGAGSAGKKAYQVFKEQYDIVAFIDKDKNKVGQRIEDVPVWLFEKELLKKYVVIMGTSYADAWNYCVENNVHAIPYECVKMIWNYIDPEEIDIHVELEERNLRDCKVVPNRKTLLKQLPKGGICAEVGVFRGDFSQKILDELQPEKLYLIDMWEGFIDGYDSSENKKYVEERFANEIRNGKIEMIQSDSFKALLNFENRYFDFVYIDTCHNYSVPHRELEITKDKIKEDGYICGHDYTSRAYSNGIRYGVKEAVNEFAVNEGYEFKYITMELEGHESYALQKIKGKRNEF